MEQSRGDYRRRKIYRRTLHHNILRETLGPTPHAKRNIVHVATNTAFNLMIDDFMLQHIQEATEQEARRQLQDDSWALSREELNAVIAVFYARGAFGANNLAVKDLWNTTWGTPFFRRVTSRDRFQEILRSIRFDVKSTRSARLQTDKFALASHTWNRFIDNCQIFYRPGENIDVDEQLFPTKVRCKWTQYIASKPDKF